MSKKKTNAYFEINVRFSLPNNIQNSQKTLRVPDLYQVTPSANYKEGIGSYRKL